MCVAFNVNDYLFCKAFAKVDYQIRFDKKQFIKREIIPKFDINNQNTN